jgi:AcrR family transcriptional regulator
VCIFSYLNGIAFDSKSNIGIFRLSIYAFNMTLKGPRKRDQKDTRLKLLKAALDVFSREGFDAATTRNIAKKAGVNESLIHRYFASKHGLFVALKQQFRENLIVQFLAYEESNSLEEELLRFIKSRLQYTRRDKKFFKLAVSRSILDAKSREDMRNYANMRPPVLLERFERFRKKGQIRQDVDLDQMIGVLQALAFSYSILLDAIECLPLEEAERQIESAIHIFALGLKPNQ